MVLKETEMHQIKVTRETWIYFHLIESH